MRRSVTFPHKNYNDIMPMVYDCGYIFDKSINEQVCRETGRLDYQLIYLHIGTGYFEIDGKKKTIGSGEIILYRPEQTQIYRIQSNDAAEIYWVYFYGNYIEKLLSEVNMNNNVFFHIGVCDDIKDIYLRIISVGECKEPFYILNIGAILSELIIEIGKKIIHYERSMESDSDIGCKNRIYNLLEIINNEFLYNAQISEYAKFCGYSDDYFITMFRKIIGIPPIEYRTKLRMNKAKSLLVDTDMKINEIALFVGYNDSLYFSRVFKKFVGISPEKYRYAETQIASEKK